MYSFIVRIILLLLLYAHIERLTRMSKNQNNNVEKEIQEGCVTDSFNRKSFGNRYFYIIIFLIITLAIAAFIIIPDTISANNYEKGVQAILDGDYNEAIIFFEKSNVEDASVQMDFIVNHQRILEAYESLRYEEAYEESLLINENYPKYIEIQELRIKALGGLCKTLLKKAKSSFEKGEYIDAFDLLMQVLRYDEDFEGALQLLDYYREHAKVMEAEKKEHGYFLVNGSSIRQREYVNIDQWHEAGYTGKGITILHDDTGNTMHSLNCQDILQTILPDARIIRGVISGKTDNKGVVEAFVTSYGKSSDKMGFDDFIEKYHISMINNSTTGGKGDLDSEWSIWMKNKIKEHNLIGFGAAGNHNGITNRFYGSYIMVSGVSLQEDGTILNYGSRGDIDFSMFMGYQGGTSYASPFLCGMAGLLKSKYPDISQEEVYEYFKNHCQKLGDEGKNTDYGWGLPNLGDPDD